MRTSARRGTLWIGLAMLVGGCGSSGSSGSSLTSGGEGEGEAAECTPDPQPVDPECVLCEPAVDAPEISGRLVVAGQESLPSAAGGDPVGVWIGRNVIVQLPENVGSMVDVANSSFHGRGWIVFDGDGSFEFSLQGEANVKLNGAEQPMVTGASGGAKGSYTVSGTTVGFSPECQFSDNEAATDQASGIRLDSNPFSVSGSTMTLQAQLTVGAGIVLDVVLELDAA